jgi:hypothetical protein
MSDYKGSVMVWREKALEGEERFIKVSYESFVALGDRLGLGRPANCHEIAEFIADSTQLALDQLVMDWEKGGDDHA